MHVGVAQPTALSIANFNRRGLCGKALKRHKESILHNKTEYGMVNEEATNHDAHKNTKSVQAR